MVSISPIINRIKSALPSTSTILTKGVGLGALGILTYDAHYVGKIQSDLYASEKDAQQTGYYLNNTLYLPSMSKTAEKVKNWSYKMTLDHTWRRFFNEGIGYVKGFGSMLVDNVVPLALGIGAVKSWKTPIIGKACAVGLALYGGYEFLKNFFGVGTPPGLDKIN